MSRKLPAIKVIGYGLALLYATSFGVYFYARQIPEMKFDSEILSVLFFVLFISSISVSLMKEWGRKLIVIANILMAAYLVKVYLHHTELSFLLYVLMCMVVFLYFSQDTLKLGFRRSVKDNWKSILIIDDDEIQLKIVRPLLLNNGFAVLAASTGEDGINIAKVQKPDLIILDVILPGLKGREVCRILKEDPQTASIPIMFMTAKNSKDDMDAEKQVGAIKHLTKPVNVKELISAVTEILRK